MNDTLAHHDAFGFSDHEGLSDLARLYGFSRIVLSDTIDSSVRHQALDNVLAPLNALASLLKESSGLSEDQARLLCGLGGRVGLEIVDVSDLGDDIGAAFDPVTQHIKILGFSVHNRAPGAMLGHEWAHALDSVLGRGLPQLANRSVGLSHVEVMPALLTAAGSEAPYQSILGALANGKALHSRETQSYASLRVARGESSHLPAFTSLAKSLLPRMAKGLRPAQRQARQDESSRQEEKLSEFIAHSAFDCLAGDEEVASLNLPESGLRAIAEFCARAVLSHSQRESARRRGREGAIDAAKSDIATMLAKSLRLGEPSAQRLASEIFHIAPLKTRIDDAFHATPYSGRSSWGYPGSLADLSCALVRVHRNQRALANLNLSKEKFIPMAFWWSMRRQVSEHAMQIETHAERLIDHLSSSGHIPSSIAEHARQWRGDRGDYKAGALMFSDLVTTGSKMIQQEADMVGRPLNEKQARGLRRKIAAPINDLAQSKTVVESFAESFEQFIAYQALSNTKLGTACQSALAHHLVESDPEELRASLNPATSWMHDKDGDPAGNAKRWRALLRAIVPFSKASAEQGHASLSTLPSSLPLVDSPSSGTQACSPTKARSLR